MLQVPTRSVSHGVERPLPLYTDRRLGVPPIAYHYDPCTMPYPNLYPTYTIGCDPWTSSLKLCDFGFAQPLTHPTNASQSGSDHNCETILRGTPDYMAPEMVMQEGI